MKSALLAGGLALLALVGTASGAERRVDLYGLDGIRSGYAIIDGAKVDYFDAQSRRTGSGRMNGAGTRTDFFAVDGRRTGYAVVDPKTGRIDFFSLESGRTGWGRVDATGRVERYDRQGKRLPGTAIPRQVR